ncbi:MAG: hypothetical protein ICV84_12300 [Flavisolibacter sp.]|nr:hypothetical protein [Flavisolibacter sp.]
MREKYGPDFNYEISCDQMCGKGHFGMRGTIIVESEAEFKVWLATQQPQYVKAQSMAQPATAAAAATDTTATNAAATRTMH